MKKASDTIERYKDGHFNIDIVSKDNLREAWLSHDDYGVSAMMFGIPVRQDGHPAMFYNEWMYESKVTDPLFCSNKREEAQTAKNGYFKVYRDLGGKVSFGVAEYYYDWEF